MGCNYYLRPRGFSRLNKVNKKLEEDLEKITEKYKNTVDGIIKFACYKYPFYKDSLDLPDLSNLYSTMNWAVEEPDIHICKMSLGWMPCFQVNKYFNTLDTFIDFYKQHKNEFILMNEYNEKVTLKEFEEDLRYFKENAKPENNRVNSSYYNTGRPSYYKDSYGFDWYDNDFS